MILKLLFIEYSNDIDDGYESIEEYNQSKTSIMLIVFDDMIVDMLSSKKCNPIATELFIRGRKLSISLIFTAQFYFAGPKHIRLNSTHYFIMTIPKK